MLPSNRGRELGARPLLLLDTNILTARARKRPPVGLREWLAEASETVDFCICFPVMVEMKRGLLLSSDAAQSRRIRDMIEEVLQADFLYIGTEGSADIYAEMLSVNALKHLWHVQPHTKHRRIGHDLLIAAISISYGIPLVTSDCDYGLIDRYFKLPGVFDPLAGMGGRSLFGRLYEMVAHETRDPAFDPIRDIMKDVAIRSLPLGPGDEFFGPVTERRLHSVQSASKQFDVHPKRLYKLLVNSGTVDPRGPKNTFERILVDAAAMEQFASDAKATIDVKETKDRLGLTRLWFEELVSGGELVPYGGAGDDSEVSKRVDRRFQISQADELLGKLRSAITTEAIDNMADISSVRRQANCTLREIFDLLLGGHLERVATVAPESTFVDIRLDPEEVKSKTRLEDHHGCFTLREIEKLLPAASRIVKALIVDGHLTSKKVRNPVKRALQTVVEPKALSQFTSTYVSIGNIATALGTRTWSLQNRFEAAGVWPAFEAAGTSFYKASDLDRL
ncbi:type II toxin-antitoxin system VapC family toxin [Rhizobium sp. BK060]|uniref:type II toxin-antitoxin system VapC family toxin n=1 Tax=Rhizobium sp. BK060 TaxID=2587096 RepID=UPI00160861AD|nr:type II toxin-antitoxin system VapC family toxin [Rhizobium sp. BK060]MBB3399127.1 putative nucleic acid-binding protein [Rhizobium sp. BK060]